MVTQTCTDVRLASGPECPGAPDEQEAFEQPPEVIFCHTDSEIHKIHNTSPSEGLPPCLCVRRCRLPLRADGPTGLSGPGVTNYLHECSLSLRINFSAACCLDSFLVLPCPSPSKATAIKHEWYLKMHRKIPLESFSSISVNSTLVFLQYIFNVATAFWLSRSSTILAVLSRDRCAWRFLVAEASAASGMKLVAMRCCCWSTCCSIATGRSALWLSTTKLLSAWRARPRPWTCETALCTGSYRITQFAAGMSIPSSATTVETSKLVAPERN
mmetsp:Transcript_134160/g.304234  ORF Transcript_134160/g.304234 Transcript_134160/m.304234 type:complete len:271 (-) Transcript_134160:898-1710(-)